VTAPHFFVDPEVHEQLGVGDRVRLSEEDSHHALRSRRLHPGEEVTISNDLSWLGRGPLAGEEGGRAVVVLEEVWRIEAQRPEIDVSMAPPKGDRLAWAVQKLSELGVPHLGLMRTERSIRLPGSNAIARMAVIAREAAMQSAQPRIMQVQDRGGLHEALIPRGPADVMLHETAAERLRDVLPENVDRVHLLVGPEGGFADSEVSLARDAGCRVASIGPGILRTETAAVVGVALVLARYGRLG
jgi:16S rRNA (uracil1498-N3)-methyltransferase